MGPVVRIRKRGTGQISFGVEFAHSAVDRLTCPYLSEFKGAAAQKAGSSGRPPVARPKIRYPFRKTSNQSRINVVFAPL